MNGPTKVVIGNAELWLGDCREVFRTLPDASVDAVVCDPPYELGFMGKSWDKSGVAFDVNTWGEALRLAKPGAHLLAFGGTRTSHRMACSIEDAGWEIRDTIMWIYGSGFPKSHNGEWGGTALKPAHEPIVMARKPLVGTVAANVLAYGTGALNIDGCRVPGQVPQTVQGGQRSSGGIMNADGGHRGTLSNPHDAGRWPANVIHDGSEEVLAAFPTSTDGVAVRRNARAGVKPHSVYGEYQNLAGPDFGYGGRGSAARFFYCAKPSKAERDFGLDGTEKRANDHPTVKPLALMRYLVRLVTPPGGVVLDLFCGSGSTGQGAVLEGLAFIGAELDAHYVDIARHRIATMQPDGVMRASA